MKKQLLLCALIIAMTPELFSQTLTSKRGHVILPEQGDFAIGVDAAPFLEYVGDLFSDKGSDAPTVKSPKLTVFGKYFFNDLTAIRASFLLDYNSVKVPMSQEGQDAMLSKQFTTTSFTNLMLNVGIEKRLKRLSNRRVQIYYGADLGIGGCGEKIETFVDDDNYGTQKTERAVVGSLTAFVGVEYFCAPKISIGGEIGYGVDCYFGIKDRFEGVENGKNANKESPIVGNGVRFGSATPASLRVMFYF